MKASREHGPACRCWRCRHARFQPGPPTSPRGLTFYGAFRRKELAKWFRVGLAQAAATQEDASR